MFLHWLTQYKTGLDTLDHYLIDDFIFAGKGGSQDCAILMTQFTSLTKEIGVPLAEDKTAGPTAENKTAGPTTQLTFLCFEIDTVDLIVRIPETKLHILMELVEIFLGRSKVTLQEMQS